jgi:hypothetical protein
MSRPALVPLSLIQLIPGGPFSEEKRPESQACHLSTPSADTKNKCSYNPTPNKPSCMRIKFADYTSQQDFGPRKVYCF